MPILERDPWRLQFFAADPCPDGVTIPTDDPDSWLLHPRHRWVYDKLKVAESQGLACGPHGVLPEAFPVFSKPLVNLKGMGIGSRVIRDAAELDRRYHPGHMWMPLLDGPHVSTDCAVENGDIRWLRHATGVPWIEGTFKYWTIHPEPMPDLDRYLAAWASRHMSGYSGMMNFESIGGRIIEAHLRFADQWCDLYGEGWVKALIGLYRHGKWHFPGERRTVGYSIPLFARHGSAFRHPPGAVQERIRAMPQVSSLQITFHETKDAADHPMPPGGFRLGIVNSTDLDAGFAALQILASAFPPDLVMDQR